MSSKKTSENSWLGNIPLTGKVSLLVGSLLTLFIVSSIGTSLVLEQEKQNRAAFRDTVNLLREVEQTNRVLYQRQSELRQLLLSPGEPDTTTLDSANTAISQHLEHLGQQVRDDAAQSTRLDGIRSLDTAWRNTVETLVLAELRRLAKAAPAEATAQRERLLPQFTARAPVATPPLSRGWTISAPMRASSWKSANRPCSSPNPSASGCSGARSCWRRCAAWRPCGCRRPS